MSLRVRGPITVALFHSMFGLRRVELAAADRLRAAGHRVVTPDLFAGAVAAEQVRSRRWKTGSRSWSGSGVGVVGSVAARLHHMPV